MENKRFKDNQEDRFTISEPTTDDPVLVVCPKCSSKTVITPHKKGEVRAACSQCGYTKDKSSGDRSFYWHDDNPTDGYFSFNLWLRTDCLGYSLWAFMV